MAENTIEIEVELVGQKETLKGLDMVNQGAEGIGETFKGVGGLIGKTNKELGEGLSSVSDAIGESKEAFAELGGAVSSVAKGGSGLITLLGPIGMVIGALGVLYETYQQLSGAAQEAEDRQEAYAAAVADLSSKLEALAENGVVPSVKALDDFFRITIKAQVAKELFEKSTERAMKKLEAMVDGPLKDYTEAQQALNKLVAEGKKGTDEYTSALQNLQYAEAEHIKAQAKYNAKLKELETTLRSNLEVLKEAGEQEKNLEELTTDSLKQKAKENLERLKAIDLMRLEIDVKDQAAQAAAKESIEAYAKADALKVEDASRADLLKQVESQTEALKRLNEQKVYEEVVAARQARIFEAEAQKRRQAYQQRLKQQEAERRMQEALAKQQLALESQLRQAQITLVLDGLSQQESLARERYETGIKLAKDNATQRALVETQYQIELKKIREAEQANYLSDLAKREEAQRQAAEKAREFAFSTAEFNAQFIQDETERELAQLKVKYDRELELAENNEALKTELIRRYGVERARVEQKASEKLAASVVGYLDFIGKGFAEAGVGALMFGDNFKESIKQVLEGLAREAAVKSLMQFAEAAAYSFVNPALAAQHATAGGLFAAVASAAKVSHMAMGGGGGGGGGSSASPSGAPLSAPAPQREQASTEAMTFNINFGGAVIYDTRRAAEQALADRVVETINRPRRGAVRMNSRG
jgi:hypothetical protein